MLTALQGHFTKISLKVWKLRRERERSVSTAVSTAGQAMTNQKSHKILAYYQQWRCVSESDNCWQTVQCAFSVICSAATQTKSARPWFSLSYTQRIRSRSVWRGNGCRDRSSSYPRITEARFQRVRMGCLELDNYGKKMPKGPSGLCVSSSQRGTVFMLKLAWPKGEVRRAEPKFWVWFLCQGTGTNCEACELKFGAVQVIMRKGVSKGTNTSCCHPSSVSDHSRDTKPYYHLLVGLYRA